MTDYPKLNRIRQKFEKSNFWCNRDNRIVQEMERFQPKVKQGQSVAICVGSRGINQIVEVVSQTVAVFKKWGLNPHIVPAMGSHGGGTPEGQREILKSLGIEHKTVGADIKDNMETDILGHINHKWPVYFSKAAREADHIFVINRVKPHTMLSGTYQSGLIKMLVVGLGKQLGAYVYHQAMREISSDTVLTKALDIILEKCKVLGGLALMENELHELAGCCSISGRKFLEVEPNLADHARVHVAKLPFRDIDILIVDEIGKDISGVGMDPNIIGRKFDNHKWTERDRGPNIRFIAVRGLSEKTAGNALGIGLAEFCHIRILKNYCDGSTFENALASGEPASAAVPISYWCDKELLDAMIRTIGKPNNELKLVRIKNTADLQEILCTKAASDQALKSHSLELVDKDIDITFDDLGNFV